MGGQTDERQDALRKHAGRHLLSLRNGNVAVPSRDFKNVWQARNFKRVTVRKVGKKRLRIGPIEVLDGTPVVDIKPVLSCEPVR